MYTTDERSGAKRKLLPLRELMSEQFELSSKLLAKTSERDVSLATATRRLHLEGELQVRGVARARCLAQTAGVAC
eukprot:5762583-Prymnesium_polylepis.1